MFNNEYLNKCLEENKGSSHLLIGYSNTLRNKYNELVINSLGFIYNEPKQLEEFKNELVKADIKEFVLTERSTALMSILHALNSVGITIEGVTIIKHIDKWDGTEEEIQGLRMIVE